MFKLFKNKKENYTDYETVDSQDDINASIYGLPIKKDKTYMTFTSTQTKEELNKILDNSFLYDYDDNHTSYSNNSDNYYENIEEDNYCRRRMPSEVWNSDKYWDVNRYNDPYIQTSACEYYNTQGLEDYNNF